MLEQGDIVSVAFPFTDATYYKKRPALVISNKKVNQTGDYLLMQITSKIRHDGLSVILFDEDYQDNILPLKSCVRVHKIFMLNEKMILKKVSKVSDKFRRRLKDEILDIIN